MRKNLLAIFAYTGLLLLSLVIPLLHLAIIDGAIESMRPGFKLSDGTWVGALLPTDLLLLRWLGQLSWFVVCVVFICLVLSFWREKLSQFEGICFVAMCQCAFTAFYIFCATLVVKLELTTHGMM